MSTTETTHESEEAPEGFFAENLLRVRSLDKTGTRILAVVTAMLLGAGGLIVLDPVPRGSAAITLSDFLGNVNVLSPIIFASVIVMLVTVLVLVLFGTMQVRVQWVFLLGPILLAFFGAGFMSTSADKKILAVPLVLVGLVFLAIWPKDDKAAHSLGYYRRPLTAVSVCVIGVLLLAWWRLGNQSFVFSLVGRVTTGVRWLLVPALILAGSDFAEAADSCAVAIVGRAGKLGEQAALWTVLAVALSGLLLAHSLMAAPTWLLLVLPFAGGITAYAAVLTRRLAVIPGQARHPSKRLVIVSGLAACSFAVPGFVATHNSFVAAGAGWGGLCMLLAFPASWYLLGRARNAELRRALLTSTRCSPCSRAACSPGQPISLVT